ncbi:MAG: SxtJ family membrane protein [Flavobacteriales bacterium]
MKLDSIKITQTLLVLSLAFMAVHLFAVRDITNVYFLYVAIVFIVLALFPQFFLSGTIAKAWLKFGEAMSWVMSKIILTLLFYLLVFPISSLYRLFNKDLLMLKRRKDSYFTERNHLFEKKDLENPW